MESEVLSAARENINMESGNGSEKGGANVFATQKLTDSQRYVV